jgi:hypothetical protein
MSTYSLYAIGIGSGEIHQVTEQFVDPGITEMLVAGDGTIYNEHASIVSLRPIVRFSSTDIATMLTLAGTLGLAISGANTPVILYFAKRAFGAGFASGSVHTKITVASGLLYPMTLRATHESTDPASIEYGLTCLGADADNAPLAIAKNQALAAYSPTIDEVFTAGPWWVNGTEIEQIQDFNLDFGLTVQSPSGSGATWPISAYYSAVNPRMTCTCHDIPAMADVTAAGIVKSGNTRAFLRQKAQGVANWANDQSKHIQFEINEGRINPQEFGGRHGEDARAGLSVTTTWDGTHAPVAVTTAQTITGS